MMVVFFTASAALAGPIANVMPFQVTLLPSRVDE